MDVTREAIVQQIGQLARAGEPLNILAVRRRHPELLRAAYEIRPFLGWRGALELAGIDPMSVKPKLTEKCRCRICGFAGAVLTYHLIAVHELTPKQYLERFPGAEIVSEKVRASKLKASAMPHWEPIWTPECVLDRMAAYAHAGHAMNVQNIVRLERPLVLEARLKIGSWDTALEKIGLSPAQCRRAAPGVSLSRQDVIDTLQAIERRNEPLHGIHKRNLRLWHAMRRHFGGYVQALEAAGIDPSQVRVRRSKFSWGDKAAFLERIRKIAKLPTARRIKEIEQLRRDHSGFVQRHFGNWTKLAAVARVESRKILLKAKKTGAPKSCLPSGSPRLPAAT